MIVGYHYFHFADEEIGSGLSSGLTQVTEFAVAPVRPEPSIPATHLVSCPVCKAKFILFEQLFFFLLLIFNQVSYCKYP